jgi:hypothetical protein
MHPDDVERVGFDDAGHDAGGVHRRRARRWKLM